ncbi:MAG: hypothetical protein WCT49_01845 [Candidatus Paceibacterota bacterium]|jgi:hypothetical protein|nr:hypothetical protein [Candidatus Paceibacterota bacterium]
MQMLYEQVIRATKPFLGPVSRRFVVRHIETHLQKKPEDLSLDDIPFLAQKIVASINAITDDKKTISALHENILALVRTPANAE